MVLLNIFDAGSSFYNICGLQDGTAYSSASAAAKNLPSVCNQFVDGQNFVWQERSGGHDFNIWNLGLYNFLKIISRPEGK